VAIDLADRKQMVVVCDHDSRVLARRTFRCRAWDLGQALDWAAQLRCYIPEPVDETGGGCGISGRDGSS
jgi:hypothetical protein